MDSQSERKLRDLRLNLAEICLEGRLERLAALCSSPSGDAIITMVNSGVRHLALTKSEQAIAERCHRVVSVEHDTGRKVSAYLGLSLFSFPQSIERSFDIIDVPMPLLSTVVKLLLSIPVVFTRDGMRRRSLAHLEATVQEIHKAAKVIDEPDFRKALLAGFMDGFSITSVYGEDAPVMKILFASASCAQGQAVKRRPCAVICRGSTAEFSMSSPLFPTKRPPPSARHSPMSPTILYLCL